MRAQFSAADAYVSPIEGIYSDDPDDNGGETCFGLTRKNNPDWVGWIEVDNYKKKYTGVDLLNAIECDTVLRISARRPMKKNYWDKLGLDEMTDQSLATELYEQAYNFGPHVAARHCQRVINVSNRNGKDYPDIKIDGSMPAWKSDGSQGETHKALGVLLERRGVPHVVKMLNVLQGERYVRIMEEDPTQEKYIGWFKRVD